MELKTRGWGEVILATLPSLEPIERLRAIRELVWREEILLIPRYSDVETAIQDTLSPIDCRERKIKGATVSNVDWISIRDDYRNIAVTMVTAARFRREIDPAIWEQMLTTTTIPFELPEPGVKIAVKVIDQTGMEHMTVIDDPRNIAEDTQPVTKSKQKRRTRI